MQVKFVILIIINNYLEIYVMAYDQKLPDFYNQTVINRNEVVDVTKNVQTKILNRELSVDIATPYNNDIQTRTRPWRISFSIQKSRAELVFELNQPILIGRSVKQDIFFDGIDLSPFNGHELGVSRNHAQITLRNKQIIIKDMNSANGTLINQQRLQPETEYQVKHGDKINFGNMAIFIYFLTPIFQSR